MSRFGVMEVISTDQGAGRCYRCPCGWEGWSAWGHARKHALTCPQAGLPQEFVCPVCAHRVPVRLGPESFLLCDGTEKQPPQSHAPVECERTVSG